MLATIDTHFVNGQSMFGDVPAGMEQVQLGMGCFWGAERILWKLDGVHVVFDPSVISFEGILKVFFENHDPTQGNRQGDDRGTQYRSTIYTYSDTQMATAKEAVARYEEAYGRPVTTELREAPKYYPAEDYHQQYLAKNPQGYCMHGPTGVTCPIPERVSS